MAKLKVNASGAGRWVPCPGAPLMESRHPDTPTHPVTEEGKAIHWACDRVMASWKTHPQAPLTLQQFLGVACPENGIVIVPEMIYAGGVYLETVWGRAHAYPEGLQTEKQLSTHRWGFVIGMRCDSMWRSEDRKYLAIDDFKYGRVPKRAYENWQLLNYALGAIDDYTETIELSIIQPRGPSAAHPVKTWIFPAAELPQWARWIINSYHLAHSESPPLHAGPWCRYCKAAAAGACPAITAASYAAFDLAERAVFAEMTDAEVAHDLELMDRATKVMRARLDALEALAIARIQGGATIPGFDRTKSFGNRTFIRDMKSVGTLFGLDLEKRVTMSPTEAEGVGLPRQVIDMFTTRRENPPKLKQVQRNESREVFYKKP